MLNWKNIITVSVFVYCLYYLSSLDSWHFIDYVNLAIHEAGHVIFIPFGYFLTVSGGTRLQLLIPVVFICYFAFRKENYSASLLVYWLALNLFNISVYASDALKMQLPLLTGDKDGHDWNQILFTLNLLRHTQFIGKAILGLGVASIIIALIWGLYESRRTIQQRS